MCGSINKLPITLATSFGRGWWVFAPARFASCVCGGATEKSRRHAGVGAEMILGAGAVSDGTQRMLCRGELIDPGQSDENLEWN